MKIFTLTLLVICSLLVSVQVVAQQTVALGATVDYDVTVQRPVGDEGYDFFWSIDMGEDKVIHVDGPVGINTVDFKNYSLGKHTISVYTQRSGLEESCASNVQTLEIEIIEKPIINITGSENTDVCSYSRVNEFTPITFDFEIIGYIGEYKIEYDLVDNNGKVIFSDVVDYLNTENTKEENVITVNDTNEDLFVNNTRTNIDFKFKVTKIEFVRGEVSNNLDYSLLTQNITILPAVELGQIKF